MSLSPRIFTAAGLLLLPLGIWLAMDGRDNAAASELPYEVVPNHSHSQWQRERLFHESFDVGSGTLDVRLDDADVEIQPGSGTQVTVEGWVSARDIDWGREVFRRADFRAVQNREGVRVDADHVPVDSRDWRRHGRVGVTAVITIPRQFDVRVSTVDGDVTIASVRANVEARTSDGDIAIQDVTGGRILLETSDGDISAAALAGEDVRLETSDGDIDVRLRSGTLAANTSDGDIVVTLEGDHGDVVLGTGDGDITIYAPATLSADIALDGADVEISRGFALQGSMGRRVIRGTLNGGGARVTARSGDGEIALRTGGR